MTAIAATFCRLLVRRPGASRRFRSVNDQCITATIEARVPGFPDFVLIDPCLAAGSAVVRNSALGRYVSGAVQRGEILRITGRAANTTLGFVQSTGTIPMMKLPVSGTAYTNNSISVSRKTAVNKITLRVSSPTNVRDVHSSQKSVPVVSFRQS